MVETILKRDHIGLQFLITISRQTYKSQPRIKISIITDILTQNISGPIIDQNL